MRFEHLLMPSESVDQVCRGANAADIGSQLYLAAGAIEMFLDKQRSVLTLLQQSESAHAAPQYTERVGR